MPCGGRSYKGWLSFDNISRVLRRGLNPLASSYPVQHPRLHLFARPALHAAPGAKGRIGRLCSFKAHIGRQDGDQTARKSSLRWKRNDEPQSLCVRKIEITRNGQDQPSQICRAAGVDGVISTHPNATMQQQESQDQRAILGIATVIPLSQTVGYRRKP